MRSTKRQRPGRSPLPMKFPERIGNFPSPTTGSGNRTASLPSRNPGSAPASSMRLPSNSTPEWKLRAAPKERPWQSPTRPLHLRSSSPRNGGQPTRSPTTKAASGSAGPTRPNERYREEQDGPERDRRGSDSRAPNRHEDPPRSSRPLATHNHALAASRAPEPPSQPRAWLRHHRGILRHWIGMQAPSST